jgi:predicted O-methyltransferase YrrM
MCRLDQVGYRCGVPTPLDRLRSVREKLIADGTVVTPDGRVTEMFPVAIGPEEGAALRDRVVEEGATRTLEVGLGFAISTLFICEGLLMNGPGQGRHVAIDPFQLEPSPVAGTTYDGVGLETLERAGVGNLVRLHQEESQVVLPRLLDEGQRFDLAFIDGNHRFEAVFLDLVYAGRLVAEGGTVFVDDTQLPAIRRAIEFCVDNLGWEPISAGSEGTAHGWSVLRTGPRSLLQRPFTGFTDFRVVAS